MGNRKDKPVKIRLLTSISSCLFIGSVIYLAITGFNLYVSALLLSGIAGLGIPSIAAGEGFLDTILCFFEALLDGIMEIISGIFELISSIFS